MGSRDLKANPGGFLNTTDCEPGVFTPGHLLDKYGPRKNSAVEEVCLICYDPRVLRTFFAETEVCQRKWPLSSRESRNIWDVTLPGGGRANLMCLEIGASLTVFVIEILVSCGAKYFFSVGSAGWLKTEKAEKEILIVEKAFIDEGVSRCYGFANDSCPAGPRGLSALREACNILKEPYQEVASWTTEAPFRETPSRIRGFRELGAQIVEMEASAAYTVAQFLGVEAASLCYISDRDEGGQWKLLSTKDILSKAVGCVLKAASLIGREKG